MFFVKGRNRETAVNPLFLQNSPLYMRILMLLLAFQLCISSYWECILHFVSGEGSIRLIRADKCQY